MVHSCKRSHRSPSEQALSTNPLQQYCCPVLSPRARRKKAQQTTQVFAHTDHFSLTTVTLKLAPNIDTAVSLAKHALFFTRQRPLPCFHDLVPRKASTPACLPGWEHSFPLLPKGPPHAVIHPRGDSLKGQKDATRFITASRLSSHPRSPSVALLFGGDLRTEELLLLHVHDRPHTQWPPLQTTGKHQPRTASENRARNECQISVVLTNWT